jgi:lambda repressor-like predicted transcriptional regulator
VRYDYARGDRSCRAFHRRADSIPILQRNCTNCRSAAAKEGTESASFLNGRDHPWKKGNQFYAKRLVKMVGKNAAQFFVIL